MLNFPSWSDGVWQPNLWYSLGSLQDMLRRLALLLALSSAASAVQRPKHVLLIVADDLGSADLGYTGSQIATPNIDRLAGEGVKLANFYVQRACSPTRAALLTGRYNIRYGFQSGVLTNTNNYSLPLNETTLPQFVHRAVAASTHMVGKCARWIRTVSLHGQ
jgi:hypothetical protein|eukprot:6688429-Prymnesium_polylepis.2